MKVNTKAQKVFVTFIALLIVSGLALLYHGYDPVAQAKVRKDGVLTAEQVKVSFDSVSGRLLTEAVKEGDHVKKGDILMVLDATDTDLSIAKTKAQIAQIEAQLAEQEKSIQINYDKIDTKQTQTFRQIDQQRAALDSANSTYQTKLSDYNRMAELCAQGAISQKEMDSYQNAMEVAQANVNQAQNGLNQLLGGAADNGDTDSLALPEIQEQRAEVDNQQNTLDNLQQQKKQLQVALQQLEVNKGRLVLKAPEDGKILKVIAKKGEMVAAGTPVILLESERTYYDIYLPETEVNHLHEGDKLTGRTVSQDFASAASVEVPGTVRLIARADGFADYKMSREKSSADLTSFQVRVYTDPVDGVIPGMTIEVKQSEFAKK